MGIEFNYQVKHGKSKLSKRTMSIMNTVVNFNELVDSFKAMFLRSEVDRVGIQSEVDGSDTIIVFNNHQAKVHVYADRYSPIGLWVSALVDHVQERDMVTYVPESVEDLEQFVINVR